MNTTNTAAATDRVVNTSTGSGTYECRYVTTVDRPWLRDASYAPVAPGLRIVTTHRFSSQSAAVRFMESILRGDLDFASEYVTAVEVIAQRAGRSPRCVRSRVERNIWRATSVRQDRELAIPAIAAHASRFNRTMMRMSASWDSSCFRHLAAAV